MPNYVRRTEGYSDTIAQWSSNLHKVTVKNDPSSFEMQFGNTFCDMQKVSLK